MPASEPAFKFGDLRAKALESAKQGNWADALGTWSEIRTRYPDEPDSYVGSGIALREAGQFEEAERLLEAAAARFADHAPIAIQRAWLANARRDWPEAVRRWQAIKPHFSDNAAACVGAAISLREAGRSDEAESLLADAAERFTGNARIALERARLANERHAWPEAVRRWQEARPFMRSPAAYVAAAVALREAGHLDEAERLLAEAGEHFPDHVRIAIERASLANARGDWSEAARRWEAVTKQWPDELQAYLGALKTFEQGGFTKNAGLIEAAQAALTRANQAGIENAYTRRLELALARAIRNWPRIRVAAERLIDTSSNPSADLLAELAVACWQLKDLEGAERAAVRALATDPNNGQAPLVLAWIADEKGDVEQALSKYRLLAPNNPRWAMETVRLLHLGGNVEEAAAELENVRQRWPDDPTLNIWLLNHGLKDWRSDVSHKNKAVAFVAREMQQIADASPRDDELLRPLVVDDPSKDVLTAPAPTAQTVVLIFTGPHDNLTMPIALFDRHLAALGVTAIYLKDFYHLLYLKGVRSLGDYDQTLAALQQKLDRVANRRLCTLGVMSGGYAAIRYGAELGAECAVCFEGPSGRPQLMVPEAKPHRTGLRVHVEKNFSQERRDLRIFLDAHPHRPAIEVVYGERMVMEEAHAKRLADLSGVTLWPQAGIEKQVLRTMAKRRDFHGLLSRLLRLSSE